MKKFTQALLAIIFTSLFHVQSFSQVSVVSTTGYQVNLNVYPSAVIPATPSNCTWGYNYVIKMNYDISFSGSNIPASLYTLQGTIGCTPGSIFFDLPNNGGSGSVNTSNAWNPASNCASVTPAILGCNMINIQINGPGISSRVVSFAPPVALSVNLLSFSAIAQSNKVKINWATAAETNNDYFSVERSADGTNWSEIKKVKGAGNSSTVINYSVYDESPVEGTSYYRLKQTDFDGKASYSNASSVKFSSLAKKVFISPVPNSGNIININGISDFTNQELEVININGKIIYSVALTKSSVELPSLQTGMYVISIVNKASGEAQNLRYVKI